MRVASYRSGEKKSMTNIDTDEAIIRLLASCPDVETLNISNGKTYTQDILDTYDKDSVEYKNLIRWVTD